MNKPSPTGHSTWWTFFGKAKELKGTPGFNEYINS